MNDRLLTDEEIDKAWPSKCLSNIIISKEQVENELLRCGQRVAQAQDSKTLKAVGKWLKEHIIAVKTTDKEHPFSKAFIDALLRGEMKG